MITGSYLGVTTLGDVGSTHTELMNAAMPFMLHNMVSHQEHQWNLLAKIFSQTKKNNLKVMNSQLFYRIIWPRVSCPSEVIASNEEHLSNYPQASMRFVLSLTSIKTSLPKNMTGYGKLVERYLTMTSPLLVICLREMPK